jgi:hypothetical protein
MLDLGGSLAVTARTESIQPRVESVSCAELINRLPHVSAEGVIVDSDPVNGSNQTRIVEFTSPPTTCQPSMFGGAMSMLAA